MERFIVRPGYGSDELLIEFIGYDDSYDYPSIWSIIGSALNSKIINVEALDDIDRDREIIWPEESQVQTFSYINGEYSFVIDYGSVTIFAENNNSVIIKDIENALLQSGRFIKEDVDFSKYK
ncbi:MAG: hypothetical protein GY754_46575 [bacterium]|nr:hypothetical protein [bacterium]